MMNTVSSTTASNANAMRRSDLSGTAVDHRARTQDPICGIPIPATAAHTCGQGEGRSSCTVAIVPASPSTNTAVAAGSTRLWPSLSIRRACGTAEMALLTRNAADTVPARA
jgi:hypothetical protein